LSTIKGTEGPTVQQFLSGHSQRASFISQIWQTQKERNSTCNITKQVSLFYRLPLRGFLILPIDGYQTVRMSVALIKYSAEPERFQKRNQKVNEYNCYSGIIFLWPQKMGQYAHLTNRFKTVKI
jgi:hypothetical protein